jgi:hypothetical protein
VPFIAASVFLPVCHIIDAGDKTLSTDAFDHLSATVTGDFERLYVGLRKILHFFQASPAVFSSQIAIRRITLGSESQTQFAEGHELRCDLLASSGIGLELLQLCRKSRHLAGNQHQSIRSLGYAIQRPQRVYFSPKAREHERATYTEA